MNSCIRPTVDVSFGMASPSGIALHGMQQLLLDIHIETFEEDMSLDEEIVDYFTSTCSSPNRSTSEDPVAKTITMFDTDFSEMIEQRPSPTIFRPISAF
mmetsp:Transcript_18234/g.29963  ORF Transcript_18234/g.29963 Transcript_18234/m.29963 type:complete len:99 (+) Transcript_18234:215-511(+)